MAGMGSAVEETPPPTVAELCARLGHGDQMLRHWAPALYRKIVERGTANEQIRTAELGRRMEMALEEDPPPTVQEVTQRLGTNAPFMRRHHPDLVHKVARRFREYEADRKKTRQAKVVDAIQDVVSDLRVAGIPPSYTQIRLRLRLATDYNEWDLTSLIAEAMETLNGPG